MSISRAPDAPLSCGVVVVRRESGALRYLLLRAYQYWDFPKGVMEEGENPLQAAVREVEEETTIRQLDFHWGEVHRETGPYRGGKVARYYIAQTHQIEIDLPVNPLLGRPEHQAFRWVSYDEAYDLVSPRVRNILDWANAIIEAEPFE
jgi:bis(5'-nucleosidyl)-tetraphosphatase